MNEPGASPQEETVSNEPSEAASQRRAERNEYPLPPATFEFFVLSMKTQAVMALGLVHFGEEKDRPEPDIRVARHSIDLLGMICEKTKGNLTLDEQRLIENSLTELRFRFVQVLESSRKQP
jgi:hypothetical protein